MTALTVDFRKHSGSIWILFLSTLPPDSGTLISKLNAKFTFIWKEDFGPLSNSPVLFLLSPDNMLLTSFLFQKWLVALFLKISERGDSWCTHSSFSPLFCEALPSVWISFALQYSQACIHPCCLCTFSYPIYSFQSTLHLICFDTAIYEEPHLSAMTLCDLPSLWRVSMIVFWTTAKSAVFPIIVVSKNKIPGIYTVWMVIYWNSNVNILIFWDTVLYLHISGWKGLWLTPARQ